jgi:two-component sensor histidine kinase
MSVPVTHHDEWMLLRELNHRINNEFTSAINLVAVGAAIAENPEVKAALNNVVELLHRHADVHRALAMPVSKGLVETAEYLRRIGMVVSRSKLDRMNIRLVLAAEVLRLEPDRCWRLGLLVHELITNSARHASFDKQSSEIKIELRRSGALVNCIVSDNGSGSAVVRPGHGLSIVNELGKSLGGRIEYASGAGCRSFVLIFPLTKREEKGNASVARRRRRAARKLTATRPLSPPGKLNIRRVAPAER